MKKNRKKAIILALLASSLLLTGCGKKKSGSICYGQCTAGAVVTVVNHGQR